MAALKRKHFLLTINGGIFSIKLPEYYDDVKTQLGFTDATDAALKTAFPTKVPELKRAGAVIEFTVACRVTSPSGVIKTRRTKILCNVANAQGAMNAVEGKAFGTGLAGGKVDIVSAYFGSRDSFR